MSFFAFRAWNRMNVASLAAGVAAAWSACPALAEPPHSQADISYAMRKVDGMDVPSGLSMNVAVPEGLKEGEKRACVVCIHGGGWAAGKRQDLDELTRQLAAQGFVAATVSYRFAPKDRFPAQIIDCAEAVRFLRKNADRFGIDPDRIGAVGFSAGAHLAMLLGVGDTGDGLGIEGGLSTRWNAEPTSSGKVNAVVAFFGPTRLDAAGLPAQSVEILDKLVGTEDGKAERLRAASPVTYVNKGDAPMLLFQGTADPLVPASQASLMADALGKAGVRGRVELIAGAGHGWGGEDLARTLKETVEFFKEELKAREPAAAKEAGKAVFVVNSDDVPDLKDWGDNAKKVCEEWYTRLNKEYGGDGYVPREKVTILFKKRMRAPAATGGGTINVNGEYVHGHADDVGMMVHELMHVVQAYPGQKGDVGWLTEGIADYVRFWEYEPRTRQAPIDKEKASYRNSYRVTAAFLGWVEKKMPGSVVKLNAQMRKGGNDEGIFKQVLGTDVDTLWKEFVEAGAPSSPRALNGK